MFYFFVPLWTWFILVVISVFLIDRFSFDRHSETTWEDEENRVVVKEQEAPWRKKTQWARYEYHWMTGIWAEVDKGKGACPYDPIKNPFTKTDIC
jgi:hypothetical protein